MANLYNLLLMLDGAIYNLIDYLYDIFDFLTRINIFSQDTYNDIVSRIYIILGVFMLFVLAYSLLRAIINPDDFAKGENSFPNLIKNVVISLVIIVLLPTVFSVAFNIQNSILNNDTIPRLVLGNDYATNTDVYDADAGRTMAYYTFMAFFHENEDWCGDPEVNGTGTVLTVGEEGTCADEILGNGALFVQNGLPLSEIRAGILREDSFSNFSEFGEAVEEGQINYMFIISTFGGIFILYVLLNFCFDMALRVIKLAFYQIIAPIPVICRILPGGNMKDVFSNWTKQVISIFFEVFIRIGIMNLGVFLITTIVKNFNGIPGLSRLTFTQELIVQALLIMGVVTFIRQAPDLLSKLLKLDTGGMKLGLMDKLAMGGGLIAAGAVGSGVTSLFRNGVAGVRNARRNFGNATTTRGRIGAVVGGVFGTARSAIGGAGSGFIRGGHRNFGSRNLRDLRGATSEAVAATEMARDRRDERGQTRRGRVSDLEARHNVRVPRYLAGAAGVGLGIGAGVSQWATGGADQYGRIMEAAANLKRGNDAILNEAEKLVDKNSNDSGIILDSRVNLKDTFKNNNRLLNLYNQRRGQSLSTWQKEIQGRASFTDFASLVNRQSFEKIDLTTGTKVFDNAGYQRAIEAAQRNYYQQTADLENAYNLLRKQVINDVANAGINGVDIGNIASEKMGEIRAKNDEFKAELVRQSITIPTGPDYAKNYDDLVTDRVNEANRYAGAAARNRNRGGGQGGGHGGGGH